MIAFGARLPAILLASSVLTLSWIVGEGARGLVYSLLLLAATAPGWPLGTALFGRRHAAGWIAAALIGYALTAAALWAAIAAGRPTRNGFLLAWALVTAGAWLAARRIRAPLVALPAWGRQHTAALALVLLLVPALVAFPFARIGERDEEGNRQYRAYFTADFFWHTALTAELSRFEMPPRNPYAADLPLHYYWAYFLLPASAPEITAAVPRAIGARLLVNALWSGLFFVGAIAMATWTSVPGRLAPAIAVALAVAAASAEGAYLLIVTYATPATLDALNNLNVDAVASWRFRALRIDSLPRSLWYTPQHAMSCALGLVAVTVAGAAGRAAPASATLLAGVALGLALMVSPFPAGAFAIIYGIVVLWDALTDWRRLPAILACQALAVAPMLLALGWCVYNATFEGAGDALRFGLSSRARATTPGVLLIKLGPLLIPAIGGLLLNRRMPGPLRPGAAGLGVGMALFYLVWLGTEPVWVGWRAGQVLLVTLPILAAAFVARLAARNRWLAVATAALLLTTGLPTTIIDAYNAQDVDNQEIGPGFRWTVRIGPAEQEALSWIRRATPKDAVVQMDPIARGRDTWTTVPTFGERRMAAGLPISLLHTPEYDQRAARVRGMFTTSDGREAWHTARSMGIDYVYWGPVEQQSYAASSGDAFGRVPELFMPVFRNDSVAIYAVSN